MSMRTIARSSSKRKSASDLASSVLPVPVGPRKRNEPVGRFGSAMPARERRTASLTASTAVVLADQPLADAPPPSAAAWPSRPRASGRWGCRSRPRRRRRSARGRPPRRPAARASVLLGVGSAGLDLLSSCGDPAVEDLAGRGRGRRRAQPLGLAPQLVELAAQLALALQRGLLLLPAGLEAAQLLLAVGEVGAQHGQPLDRGVVALLGERELLHLEPVDLAAELVDLLGRGLDLHPQPRRRLVDQVDRLVGQLAAGDVAVGEGRGGDQRGVGDPDAVVGLVLLLDAAQDLDGVLDAWARRRRPAGSGARGRGPSRSARGTRRGWSRRSCAARRAPASA